TATCRPRRHFRKEAARAHVPRRLWPSATRGQGCIRPRIVVTGCGETLADPGSDIDGYGVSYQLPAVGTPAGHRLRPTWVESLEALGVLDSRRDHAATGKENSRWRRDADGRAALQRRDGVHGSP